ncbi:hypothetical protein EOD04_22350 [Mesorhizobium sp. M2C.T.Ca.TU.009.01.2.1]|jgi:hypothetical protein|nr:hypothetical protein EOD07_03370 [Mesorhizobium sp. M2C.T.Ca.TU.002.02.1.1]RUU63712.1 hypothetical protein EOD04_22350 [Mesorhizobium sp. M2C.T.Ca.TU.009.01.2.1]
MCNSVVGNGREYTTPRDLAALVGGEDKLIWQTKNPFVPWPEGKDWHDLDLCLCAVDMNATLGKAGLHWHRGDDPMQYFID